MINFLSIYENEMPTVSTMMIYWSGLEKTYGISSRFVRLCDLRHRDLVWCDVIVLIRPNNSLSWRVARSAGKSGRFVITMCDDDLLHLPKSHPVLPWQRNGFIKALNNSSVIMSSSKYLIDQMIGYTVEKRGAYVDTIVKPEELLARDYENERNEYVRLVYAAGGGQHEAMFEQLVLPALKKIASRNPNSFSLTFVSVHPNCNGLEKDIQVNYVEGMPLLEYRRFMNESKFDIGVSPLENNDFTKCKYFNKYLEYTLSGIVGIYSKVEPYTFVVNDGDNGFLAENNDESWEEKLICAIENSALRISCARNAQKHVRSKFNEKSIMEKLFLDIPELCKSDIKKEKCRGFSGWKIHYQILKCIEYIYKSIFYLKREGFSSVKRKIFTHLNKLIT